MAKRRVWAALSSDYRTRLMRSGITQDTYEAGISLKKARGHSETPEHPIEAIKQPSKYQKYRNKMGRLQQKVWERKQGLWEREFKWNGGRARRYVMTGDKKENVKQPGVIKMQQMLDMTEDELYEAVSEQAKRDAADPSGDDDWRFLFYH